MPGAYHLCLRCSDQLREINVAKKCPTPTFLEREDREFKEVMREQVGTIFPSANGLHNVESLKCLLILVLTPIVKNGNLRPHLPQNYANFYEG